MPASHREQLPGAAKQFPHKVRIALGLAISDVPSSRSGCSAQSQRKARRGRAKLQVSPGSQGEASGRRAGASTKGGENQITLVSKTVPAKSVAAIAYP